MRDTTSCSPGLLLEGAVSAGLRRHRQQSLGQRQHHGRPCGQPSRDLFGDGVGVIRCDHAIDQSEPFARRSVHGFAEHQQFGGLAQPDDSRQQVDRTRIRKYPAMHECLDKLCLRGHDDQIARQHQAGSGARGCAFHRGDHRLVTVQNRGDQALPALLQHSRDVPWPLFRHRLRFGPRRSWSEARACAEVPSAGCDATAPRGPRGYRRRARRPRLARHAPRATTSFRRQPDRW